MSDQVRHVIVGTAGHIDHGKTALVKALTGFDTDTLAEEKRRGITIELGFAFLNTPGFDRQIVFIDVPGHEKLIKTMVAGASSLDAGLLVVAADEGVNVQTVEHFDILRVLGIPTGLIAITKSDLADADRIEAVAAQARELVSGSFLEGAPVIPVSAVTGAGLDELKSAVVEVARSVPERRTGGAFRMPVDRAFTMRGFGAVIAGTILSGEVGVGDRLEILPDRLAARVRGIQVHSKNVEKSSVGTRTAVNLQDVRKDQLRRGQTACAPGVFEPTSRIDGRLEVLRSCPEELKDRARVRFHVGTDEVMARVTILQGGRVRPGESALAQFALETKTVAAPKDRFVIRAFSSLRVIGGGVVLDAHSSPHRRRDAGAVGSLEMREVSLAGMLEQAFLKSGREPLSLEQAASAVGESPEDVAKAVDNLVEQGRIIRVRPTAGRNAERDPAHESCIHADVFAQLTRELKDIIGQFYAANPYRVTMPVADLRSRFVKRAGRQVFDAVVAELSRSGALVLRDTRVGLAGREPAWRVGQKRLAERVAAVYEEAGFASPAEDEVRAELGIAADWFEGIMIALLDQDVLVRLSDRVTYHFKHARAARDLVAEHIATKGGITAAELRDVLGLSRKYAISILEYLDNTGFTRRVGDRRVLR